MNLTIFDVVDNSIIFKKNNDNVTSYLITKEEYLKSIYSNLSPILKEQWDKDKKNPSRDGIISKYLQKHMLSVLDAIDRGNKIPEKVLMQYEAFKVLFFEN